jgi:hypothetical protein
MRPVRTMALNFALRSLLTLADHFMCMAVLGPMAHAQNVQPARPGLEMLSYGSRAGMDVTVISKQGIGTTNAVIAGRLTRENARHYCEEYVLDSSRQCIDTYLKDSKLTSSISANCETGVFSTFYGEKFRYVSKNPAPDDLPEYKVIDLKDDTPLDGSSASGLSYNMEQYKALCPGLAPTNAPEVASLPPSASPSLPRAPRPNAVLRGWGYVPFAIVCADYDTAELMFRLFNHYAEETMVNKWTGGASTLVHGKPTVPDEAAYGCTVFAPGTKAVLERKTPVPVVVATTPDGKTVRGVTTFPMVKEIK